MEKGIKNDSAEKSVDSKISEISENKLKNGNLEARIRSSEFSNVTTFSFASPIVAEWLEENIVQNTANGKNDSILTLTTNVDLLESVGELAESRTEVEVILESIILQTEETEEMLDMISRAQEKLEHFDFQVQEFVKPLQTISKHLDAKCGTGNTYLKSVYQKKLIEFASGILHKIKKSIKDLEVEYEILKKQEKEIAKTFGNITDFHQISGPLTMTEIDKETGGKLKETAYHLVEGLYLLKPKQLLEIQKVSYIKTDIEMLYDLYRRFTSIK